MTTKMRGSFGGEKNTLTTHMQAVAHLGQKLPDICISCACMWTCVPFPPKILDKTRRCARTHLAFHEIWDTIVDQSIVQYCHQNGDFLLTARKFTPLGAAN
jgi:hypothetical protein